MNELLEFIASYENALASQKWANVAPLIHEDCVAIFREGTFVGKSDVEQTFRKTFALIQEEQYAISRIHWVKITDDFAVLTYIFNWSGKIHGKASAGSGRGSTVLVKESGGWQILSEHLGPLPA